MKRFLACFVAAALLVLTASSCSSTLSDAATIRFQLGGHNYEEHVSRSDLMSEVRKIAANKPFVDFLTQQGYSFNGDRSAGSDVTAIWLDTMIQQKAFDALYVSRHLSISPTLREQVTANIGSQLFPSPDIFSAFDGKFREQLIEREARQQAVYSSYLDTSDAAARKLLRGAQGAVRVPVGQGRRAHPRQDPGRGRADHRPAPGRRIVLRARAEGLDRLQRGRAADRWAASHPARTSHRSRRRPTPHRSTRRSDRSSRSSAIT